ncbi:MAG: YicC/YloC family endoribonuclease [Bacteroidales bacterium]
MIKSMTGFGKASCELPNKKILVEIKTLNSKQMDINAKLPVYYREKETEIRSFIASKLERGKADVYINVENIGGYAECSINKDVIKAHYNELKQISDELGEQPRDFMSLLMKMPDIYNTNTEEIGDEEWKSLMETIHQAILNVDEFRINEGNILCEDLMKRIEMIEQLLKAINPYEANRIQSIKDKLWKNLNDMLETSKIDNNRFEQEIIYYLEKIDITEEKTRLKKHLDYFTDTLKTELSQGKKLSFVCQEIGREINTIGSKANDVNIQQIVVQMKDELEKIKEQLMNIL